MKKFDKFKYQAVQSTHKGFYEILVTFEYKEKPCHYYAFIKEKAKASQKYYLDEAKNEINKMIKNGQLEKRAKRYLGYQIKEEDKLVVKSVGPKVVKQGGAIFHKPSALFVHILICVLGALFVAAGAYSIIKSITLSNWPDYVLKPEEIANISIHLYVGIACAVIGVAGIVTSTILHIRRIKHKK